MEKLFIKNRHDQKIVVVVEKPEQPAGLAFVMHGLGGIKSAPHIETFARVLLDNNYIVIRFDATHTYGESEGDYADATVTNYYEDLEDVINWTKAQIWYREPFILCGHSLGGICSGLYAEKFPKQVKALAPISTVVSGRLSYEAHKEYYPEELAEWEKTGWEIKESHSQPGIIKRLKWSHMADRLRYNLLEKIDNLIMPTLLIVGERDDLCPPAHQEILFKALPGTKELHVIKGAPHTFCEEKQLEEIYTIMDRWLKSLN